MNPLWQIIPMWTPFLPTNCSKPPTIYALLESIVNYGQEQKTSISNLAKAGRTTIFDFDYPLSEHIDKEDFECMILNHFMMRRIGFETPTAFKLALNVKLNEIMPNYNLLIDAMNGWNLFEDMEVTTRNVVDSRNRSETNSQNSTTTMSSTSSDSNTSDRRFSDTPNNSISDVKSGTYVTDYNYDQSTGTASSTTNGSDSISGTNTGNESGNLTETITHTDDDDSRKMDIYLKFIQRKKNIYTLIFKDLDVLFYQVD